MTDNKITQEQLNERLKSYKKAYKELLKTHPPLTEIYQEFAQNIKLGMDLIECDFEDASFELQQFSLDKTEEILSFYKEHYIIGNLIKKH